ncbi:MAG: leucine-rich repeat protein [Clostridia bacterium]|nr:leucine-rich repeat protein [Clostridia bacterium]
MKKKILLGIVMVLAVMCMLVVSVSAVEIDGVHYTLNTKNKTAQVSTDNKTSTTEIVEIPSTVEYDSVTYQVTSIANDAFSGNASIKELHILSEYITAIPGGMISNTYGNTNFTKIIIDFTRITTIGSAGLNPSNQTNGNDPKVNNIYYYDLEGNKITTFDFPNIEYIGFAAFQGANFDSIVLYPENVLGTSGASEDIPYSQCFRLTSAESLTIKGDVEIIYCYQFQGMTNLKSVRIESTNLKKVGGNAFAGCKNIETMQIDLSKCEQVGGSAFCFSGSKETAQNIAQWLNLDGEKMVDISSVQKISSLAFAGSNLGSARVLWPTNYSKVNFGHTSDSGAFRNANLKGTLYFDTAEGESVFIDSWAFRGNQIDTVILGPGVTSIAAAFGGVTTIKTVVFLADSVECTSSDLFYNCSGITFYHKELTNKTTFSQATQIKISDGSFISYGACGLDCNVTLESDGSKVAIATPVHTWDEGTINESYCPVGSVVDFDCIYCVATKTEGEGTEHSHTIPVIVYENGFLMAGVKTLKCSNDGCTSVSDQITEVSAIFVVNGYSAPETEGKKSILFSYAIDREALLEYNNCTDEKIVGYGLLAGSQSAVGTTEIFDGETVKENVKVAKVGFEDDSFDLVEIKIIGLENTGSDGNPYADLPLYCCGYVLVKNGDSVDSYYIGEGKITETLETTVTYTSIVNK